MGMGTPINLGKIFGVYVRLDVSLFLVAAIFVLDGMRYGGLSGVVDEITFVILFFFCIFLHELGHAGGAALFGISTLDITLTFFGGYARLARPGRTTLQEVVISFAGPATNLAIAGLLYLWFSSPQSAMTADHSWYILKRLQFANLILGIFNLLPGYPLDGGNIARAILTKFMPRPRARVIVGYLGVGVGFLLVAQGLQGGFGLFFGFLLIYWASIEIQAANSSRF
jgi:Zn-dependent protease